MIFPVVPAGQSASQFSQGFYSQVSTVAHFGWSPPLTDEEEEGEDEDEDDEDVVFMHEEVHIFYRRFSSTRPDVLTPAPQFMTCFINFIVILTALSSSSKGMQLAAISMKLPPSCQL